MSWEVWASLIFGAIGATFQVLSWNNDRKILKRNNPPSHEGKTDHLG